MKGVFLGDAMTLCVSYLPRLFTEKVFRNYEGARTQPLQMKKIKDALQ